MLTKEQWLEVVAILTDPEFSQDRLDDWLTTNIRTYDEAEWLMVLACAFTLEGMQSLRMGVATLSAASLMGKRAAQDIGTMIQAASAHTTSADRMEAARDVLYPILSNPAMEDDYLAALVTGTLIIARQVLVPLRAQIEAGA